MTLWQLHRNKRIRPKKKTLVFALKKTPHKYGVCTRVYTVAPKKPNSAKRKVARVRLMAVRRFVIAYIPGIGHDLQQFSKVLVRGGRVPDLPGVHYTLVRGKFDLKGIPFVDRRKARSRYGTRLPIQTLRYYRKYK